MKIHRMKRLICNTGDEVGCRKGCIVRRSVAILSRPVELNLPYTQETQNERSDDGWQGLTTRSAEGTNSSTGVNLLEGSLPESVSRLDLG